MRISSRKRGQVSESRHTETLNSIELWVRTDHAVCHWRTGAATATSGRSPQDLPAGWRTRLIQGKCDRQAPYAALRSQPKPPRHTSTLHPATLAIAVTQRLSEKPSWAFLLGQSRRSRDWSNKGLHRTALL